MIAAQRKGRRRKNGESYRMDGVDLAVFAERKIVGLQRSVEVGTILFPAVIVFNLQVAVVEQALRDDEVVRFVAARKERRVRQSPGDRAEGDRARKKYRQR